jgi:hypothetical protein
MATTKPDLTRIWANGAPPANVVDPDTTTPGKVLAGWQAEVPPFEHFNFLQKWFTQGLAHFNEQGIGIWDTDTTYPIDGIVKGSDGEIYKSVLEQSGNDPVSDIGTNWKPFSQSITKDTVSDMTADTTLRVGQFIAVLDYATGNNSGVLFFKVVSGVAPSPDGGAQIDHDTLPIHFVQNLPAIKTFMMWGAKGNNSDIDDIPVQAAWDYLASVGGGIISSGDASRVYLLNNSIKGTFNSRLIGQGTFIANAGFTGVTLLDAANADTPTEIKALLYFVEGGKLNDPAGPQRTGAVVEKGPRFNGSSAAEYGVWAERYIGISIDAECINTLEYGVRLNLYCWNSHVGSYIHGGVGEGGLWLGGASNGINLDGLFIWGESTSLEFGIVVDGDNNGLCLDGGTIEKVDDGIFCQNGNGPLDISGMDFEVIGKSCIRVDGSAMATRPVGPINVTGSFLESDSLTEALVRADNAVVNVEGCRLRRGAKLANNGTGNNSVITFRNNINENSIPLGDGMIVSETVFDRQHKIINRLRNTSTSFLRTYEIQNNASSFNEDLVTSGLFFEHAVQDTPTQFSVSYAELFVDNELGGVSNQHFGIAVNGKQGAKRVTPLADNDTEFGYASLRWKEIFSGNGTINTSDERLKTELLDIDSAELAVAKELKTIIKKYCFKDSVDEKGDGARIHFGVGAQTVIEIFKNHGLDATKYALLCYNKWDDSSELEIKSGDRYGIRYDELLAFIIAGL